MTVPKHLLKRSKNLRRNQTPAENKLWSLIRNKQIGGYKFRRQHVLFSYIVDFYCHSEKLIVELDGPIHNSTKAREYDQKREAWLLANGYKIIRFKNAEIFENQEKVLQEILEHLNST